MVNRDSGRAVFIRPPVKPEMTRAVPEGELGTDIFVAPNEPTVHSIELTEDGRIEVVHRVKPNIIYGNGQFPPDTVWKEVYEARDGKIHMTRKIPGQHVQARLIPEKLIFKGDPEFDPGQTRLYRTGPQGIVE
jgi:hypothetical protein